MKRFASPEHLNVRFIGIILLPIIGNAAEHYTAITVAMRNKMDLALGRRVSGCDQITAISGLRWSDRS